MMSSRTLPRHLLTASATAGLLAAFLPAACNAPSNGAGSDTDRLTKEEARALVEAGDVDRDLCGANGWYSDGTCDAFCLRPDPDCAVACGSATCPAGQVCCNASCGICTPPGGACTQQVCDGEDVGVQCGDARCPAGQVCCNASCGICTPPGGMCTQQVCE